MIALSTLHIRISSTVAVTRAVDALAIFLVLFTAAIVGRGDSRVLGAGLGRLLRRRGPSGNFPDDTGEALELEATSSPFAAWLSGSVKGTQSGVDGALVGFGTKLVPASTTAGCGFASTVVT